MSKPSRLLAIAESLLTTIIWGSSFVFVKMALNYTGPLAIAGLRYFLAFLLLLPLTARHGNAIASLSARLWMRLFLIGLSAYAVGNGALFWGLKYLPATTGSFLMSLILLLVLFLSIPWLREVPTRWQIVGVPISLIGSWLFFSHGLSAEEPLGIGIVAVGLMGFAFFGILGREVARDQQVDTPILTAIPLGFGGGLLLLLAFLLGEMQGFSTAGWGIVLLLTLIHTAFAYMLYNHSLQVLTALEINVMLNLSPLATAVIAWFLLSERLTLIQIAGMATVIVGATIVQCGTRRLQTPPTR